MHACSSAHHHSPRLNRRDLLRGLTAGSALACGCVTLSSCATNPATGEQTLALSSINDDVRTGAKQYPELIAAFGGAYDTGRLQSYVTAVGRKVAAYTELPDLPYEFTVLNSPIINAMALPGGKIAVTRGLLALASTEAELAGVLAHEVGHVNARHGAQSQGRATIAQLGLAVLGIATGSKELVNLGSSLAQSFLQKYSRDQEFEADSLGVRYLSRAGYDPAAMASFLGSMHEQSQVEAQMQGLPPGQVDEYNIMSSHPRTVERVQQAAQQAGAITVANPVVNREGYLGSINGMVFADDPSQGFVRGQTFIHTGLSITFTVPDGFTLRNSTENVTAQDKYGSAIVFDMAPVQRSRTLIEYLQNEWVTDIRLSGLENLQVNGMAAATGTARVQSSNRVADLRVIAFNAGSGRVYRFLFVTDPRVTDAQSRALRETTYSLRRIDAAEAAKIKPLRIIVAQARDGDTVDALSRTLPYGQFNDEWFRLLNDLKPGEEVAAGRTIKIVTS
ncbi:MAG: M48 family metalloprotease [Rhodobacteraceae bacterium]|nr:M48 family metalloprotease [Paracoccaceae bacterium]